MRQAANGAPAASTLGARLPDGPARIKAAVAYLQAYLATYAEQPGYERCTVETLVDDVLYGLGVALDKDAHENAAGFRRFQETLRVYLGAAPPGEPRNRGVHERVGQGADE